jgi:hypothetical protein
MVSHIKSIHLVGICGTAMAAVAAALRVADEDGSEDAGRFGVGVLTPGEFLRIL